MSGGSFNYLYRESLSDLLAGKSFSDLDEMATILERLAPGHPVTKWTVGLRERAIAEPSGIPKAVADVWHAIEWEQSNDWGPQERFEVLGETAAWKPSPVDQL